MECKICGTTLSVYNKLDRCFCHGIKKGVPETYPIEHALPTVCTSRPDKGLIVQLEEEGIIERRSN